MIKHAHPLRTKPPMDGVRLDPDSHRELGEGDMGLTGLAVVEATHKLSPSERAELLQKLDKQQVFFRRIEVD